MGADLHGWLVYYYQGCIDSPHKLGCWRWPAVRQHMSCVLVSAWASASPEVGCALLSQAGKHPSSSSSGHMSRRCVGVVACPCVAPCLDWSVPCTPLFVDWHCHCGCVYVCACTMCAASLSLSLSLLLQQVGHTPSTGGWSTLRVEWLPVKWFVGFVTPDLLAVEFDSDNNKRGSVCSR